MTDYTDYGYTNDSVPHNINYTQDAILSLVNKNSNKCILDLGCGNGYLVNHLIALGFNAYGTDASEKGITIARKTNPDNFFVQDLSTGMLPLPLQQFKFDTVISTEVIEHLYDPEGFIDFCRSCLNGKGEIIISTPYHGYLKNLVLSLLNKWDTHMNPLWLGGHIKFWSRRTLQQLLVKKGFTVTHFTGCGRFPFFWKSMVIKARLN